MKYQYELACREAGVDEEKLRAIRRVFDTDRKRLKRENEMIEKENYQVFHMSAVEVLEHPENYEIADVRANVEENFIHRLDLELLHRCLEKIDEADRDFILTYFGYSKKCVHQTALAFGMSVGAVKWKRDVILKRLRKLMDAA